MLLITGALLWILLVDQSSAFAPHLRTNRGNYHLIVRRQSPGNDGESNESDGLRVPLPEDAPYWTTTELKRRTIERQLLEQLYEGDEVIPEFKKIWYAERGRLTEKTMFQAELDVGLPQKWDAAETALCNLIHKDPTYLEPYVRLSKLYCLQQRFDESKALSLAVLRRRPWHFVALETMVALYTAEQNSLEMRLWDARRLPRPSEGDRRKEWVTRALRDADFLLESKSRKDFLGPNDLTANEMDQKNSSDDSWQ